MSPDSAYIVIGKTRIDNFISYRIDSNLFQASDSFEAVIPRVGFAIPEGSLMQVFVNNELEMTGVIDGIEEIVSSRNSDIKLKGRDLMGLLVDSRIGEYGSEEDIPLKDLATKLLKDVPFIEVKKIIFGEGDKAHIVHKKKRALSVKTHKKARMEPADTIFQVLSKQAQSRGFLFFSMPDGTFVFGKPTVSGKPAYNLSRLKNNPGNNIISGGYISDISMSYSSVTVVGQQQGLDHFLAGEREVKSKPILNPDFPSNFKKPFVVESDDDGEDPDSKARLVMEKQRFDAFQLRYEVPEHSQAGINYQANAICHINDEELSRPVIGDYLIYSRTFTMSKQNGVKTQLNLSRLGIRSQ